MFFRLLSLVIIILGIALGSAAWYLWNQEEDLIASSLPGQGLRWMLIRGESGCMIPDGSLEEELCERFEKREWIPADAQMVLIVEYEIPGSESAQMLEIVKTSEPLELSTDGIWEQKSLFFGPTYTWRYSSEELKSISQNIRDESGEALSPRILAELSRGSLSGYWEQESLLRSLESPEAQNIIAAMAEGVFLVMTKEGGFESLILMKQALPIGEEGGGLSPSREDSLGLTIGHARPLSILIEKIWREEDIGGYYSLRSQAQQWLREEFGGILELDRDLWRLMRPQSWSLRQSEGGLSAEWVWSEDGVADELFGNLSQALLWRAERSQVQTITHTLADDSTIEEIVACEGCFRILQQDEQVLHLELKGDGQILGFGEVRLERGGENGMQITLGELNSLGQDDEGASSPEVSVGLLGYWNQEGAVEESLFLGLPSQEGIRGSFDGEGPLTQWITQTIQKSLESNPSPTSAEGTLPADDSNTTPPSPES